MQIGSGAANNQIGGNAASTTSALGNTIAYNKRQGVVVADFSATAGSTAGNSIRFDSVFSNATLDIDLNNDGISPNRKNLTGPNGFVTFPTINTATPGSTTAVSGTYSGAANKNHVLDFYATANPSAVTFGGSQKYVGSITVHTDASGNATFSGTLSGSSTTSQWITATATDASTGSTSEFSLARKMPATTANATTPVTDLLVLYTTAALSQAGSLSALQTLITQSLDLMNRALNASQVDLTVRLVNVSPVSYTEAGTLQQDLDNLSSAAHPLFPTLSGLRTQYGADQVILIAGYASGVQSGGVAYEPFTTGGPNNGFAVVCETALGANNTTVAHEFGHTLGAGHERGNASGDVGIYEFSHGYRFNGSNGVTYHDVMSYDPGITVNRYSNPAQSYAGAAFGIADPASNSADLVSTFYYTRFLDQSFYPTVVADTTAPKASLYQTIDNNGSMTAIIRFTDESALNTATITSNALKVTSGGVNVPVQLVSVDRVTNGSIRYATFKLTPPIGASASSLQYSIAASQVSDQSGNFMPAQTLAAPTTEVTGYDFANAADLGSVGAGLTSIVSGNDLQLGDTYKMTVVTTTTLTLNLGGYSGIQNLYLEKDSNNNGLLDSGTERLQSAVGNPGSESITAAVSPGVYYLQVTGAAASAYTLTYASDSAITVDNGSATLTGSWSPSTTTPGYYGTGYLTDGNTGKGAKTATYAPNIPLAGVYQVYARWTSGSNRATNAPIDILSANGTSTVTVNQQNNNGTWVLLGTYAFNAGNSGKIVIRTTGTNGYVIADAVQLVPVKTIAVDNAQATLTGSWVSSTTSPGYYSNDYLTDNNAGKGAKSARFTPTIVTAGQYEVYARWTAGSNRATNVPIDITDATGTRTVTVNQQNSNNTWVPLGAFTFATGTGGSVTIRTTGTNGYVVADAVEFVPIAPNIVDDTQATLTGTWTPSTFTPGYYGAGYLSDGNTGKGTKTATFTPDLAAAGTYQVFARWTAGASRAANVPFDILHNGTTDTVTVNEQANNGVWVLLGTFSFAAGAGGNVTVRTTGTNGYVIADAVEFVKV